MSRAGAKLQFWYEFASTYSYLSAMRIEAMAKAADIAIEWRPFLLGPIFHAQGWDTSPFNLYPAKGRYMVRDIERLAGSRGLVFRLPTPFPQNSLQAARLALIGCREGWVGDFTRAVYRAQFADGADLSARSLGSILQGLNLDADRLFALTASSDVKDNLKAQTSAAQALGIFGAPTFVTGGELFWGDDRLEQALDHARQA